MTSTTNRGPELLAVIWSFLACAIICVSLKYATVFKITRSPGWEDWFIGISLGLSIICVILMTVGVHYGLGQHTANLTHYQQIMATKMIYLSNPFCIMSFSLPNVAVAIFINRILDPPMFRKFMLAGLSVLQCVIASVCFILLFTNCQPVESLWDPQVKPEKCLPINTLPDYTYFAGSFTAFTDVVLAIVPIISFWNLQMDRKDKLAVCILMSLTLFSAVCAIVKTTYLGELADLKDFTYGTMDLYIWSVIEQNVIISAACIPSIRPLFTTMTGSRKRRILANQLPADSQARSVHASWGGNKGFREMDSELAVMSKHPGCKTSTAIVAYASKDGTDSETESLPQDGIKQTTDVTVEYEAV